MLLTFIRFPNIKKRELTCISYPIAKLASSLSLKSQEFIYFQMNEDLRLRARNLTMFFLRYPILFFLSFSLPVLQPERVVSPWRQYSFHWIKTYFIFCQLKASLFLLNIFAFLWNFVGICKFRYSSNFWIMFRKRSQSAPKRPSEKVIFKKFLEFLQTSMWQFPTSMFIEQNSIGEFCIYGVPRDGPTHFSLWSGPTWTDPIQKYSYEICESCGFTHRGALRGREDHSQGTRGSAETGRQNEEANLQRTGASGTRSSCPRF